MVIENTVLILVLTNISRDTTRHDTVEMSGGNVVEKTQCLRCRIKRYAVLSALETLVNPLEGYDR